MLAGLGGGAGQEVSRGGKGLSGARDLSACPALREALPACSGTKIRWRWCGEAPACSVLVHGLMEL